MKDKKSKVLNQIRFVKRYIQAFWGIVTNRPWWRKDEMVLVDAYYQVSDMPITDKTTHEIVFMIDGRTIHGGLTDRLCGICSVFSFCQEHGIPFRLNAIFPFELKDYLEPNEYDWSINTDRITYDSRISYPIFLDDYRFTPKLHATYLSRMLNKYKQLHVYGNTPMLDIHFHDSFNTLFRPSAALQQAIGIAKQQIGNTYVAIVTRFQQLLGDFKEGEYKVLPKEEQVALITKCVNKVRELHDRQYPHEVILCTSDSSTFLSHVSLLPYVRIIPGKVVHIDHTAEASFQTYLKSFVDMYMIAGANKVVLLQTGDMYPSKFPYRASKIGGKPFERLIF